MKDYINIVLSKIQSGKQRKFLDEELKAHFEDRVDYYVNAGYDTETAAEKANAHMGRTEDAELVGEQLEAIHKAKYKKFVVAAFGFINLGALYLFWNFFIFGLNDGFITGEIGLFFSAIYLTLVFCQLFAAVRIKSAFLASSCAVMVVFHALFMMGYVPSVFCFYEMLIGKGKALGDLLWVYNWQCKSAAVYILSGLFLISSLSVSLAGMFQIMKFNRLQNGRNYYKTEKKIQTTAVVLLVFVVAATAAAWLLSKNTKPYEWTDGFYIVESDTMIDPQSIEHYDDKRIELKVPLLADYDMDLVCDSYEKEFESIDITNDSEWDAYIENYPLQYAAFMETFEFYNDLNHACKYKTLNIRAELHTDKKYVMLVPFGDESGNLKIYFDRGEWTEVSDNTVLKYDSKEYIFFGAFIEYEINLIPE